MVNFGERLRTLRTENKLTQGQVASRVGVATSAISSYESGVRLPSYTVLIKLSRLFHVTIDHLLGAEKKDLIDISDLSADDKQVVKATVAALRAKYQK